MTDKKCPNRAEYVYPWAGKLMKACESHARAMSKIAQAIGSPIQVQKINTKEMCMHMDDLQEENNA